MRFFISIFSHHKSVSRPHFYKSRVPYIDWPYFFKSDSNPKVFDQNSTRLKKLSYLAFFKFVFFIALNTGVYKTPIKKDSNVNALFNAASYSLRRMVAIHKKLFSGKRYRASTRNMKHASSAKPTAVNVRDSEKADLSALRKENWLLIVLALQVTRVPLQEKK